MIPIRSNVIHQDLGVMHQLVSQHKFLGMDDEGVELWWEGLIKQLALLIKQKLYYYDTNGFSNHPDKFNFHAKFLTNSIIEEYVSLKDNASEYLTTLVKNLINKVFNTRELITVELLLSDTNFYSLFLRLKNNEAIIESSIDYNNAGIRLSGSDRFSYPEGSDKRALPAERYGRGAYYNTDSYPNMPRSADENAKYIRYDNGVFYKLL